MMEQISEEQLRQRLASFVEETIKERHLEMSDSQRRALVTAIQNEVMGLGPLESLLADPTISDILVNGPFTVFVERKGKLELTDVKFTDEEHLIRIIDKIVSRIGRRVDESSPMVDARLPDGSRVNAIIPPLALDGAALSIRRFPAVPLSVHDLVDYGSMTPEMSMLIAAMVKSRLNILISGGTGSGKTTLLNVLSSFIPDDERLVTIEDAAELRLQQPHVVRLETRPANVEGTGEINQRALIRNSLRMRPDRVIIGEVRGAEVIDMFQAMNTGHEGSMATIHANNAHDALSRLENMVGISGIVIPVRPLRQTIVSALTAIIQASRLSDGKRKVMSILEITGMEGDMITTQEIFKFQQTGIAADGAVLGRHRATGVRPRFMDRLLSHGSALPERLFDPDASR
ncbi:MAG: CpaF family protein [Ferrovum myxofaciens]|uniref:CpaF family protein n=4 Tax=root TaxID=1 RepID=A0A9E6N0S8_9PROT|nr:CpaF family protein [Ferrovum myxofaciens]MBW8028637.1 ATP-binding cassette domain-containing protein [Ferrovum sp.]QKE39851.1 MAG: CpaF family protein [Ferrovum myxofaciens]QWY76220.1 MAG: CpaF family protein [Ferrovum myxofaciens]QWY78881.1 MAG: CpaF family protein [Ferrovum myxofaciens]